MADQHGHGHSGPNAQLYLIIFAILCVCTAVSFMVFDSTHQSLWPLYIIMTVAVIKAGLVSTYFMHLKWDWRLVFFIMFPVFIVSVMMIIILLPDIVVGWHHD